MLPKRANRTHAVVELMILGEAENAAHVESLFMSAAAASVASAR